jgi:ATP-dependent Clp protease ATP-binding subunit ClpX
LFICGGAFDGLEDIIKKKQGSNVLGFNQDKKSKNDHDKVISKVETDDLVKYGLIPELIGRLHMVATLNEITEDDMVHILTEPKNALIKQYIKLFAMDDVKLEFEKDALQELAKLAIVRKTGARGLRSILEDIMLDIMFDLPKYKNKTVTISKEVVLKTKEPKVA